MECSFGITGKDYVIFASDSSANRSIVRMKSNSDKQKVVSKHVVMAYSGEPGDTVQFAEYVERNLRLYGIRNHVDLLPHEAASWTRNELASSLRSRNAYSVNLLLGGFDTRRNTMDRFHRPDMDLQQGLELLKRCINELSTRFIVNLGTFKVRVADKDGVREVEL
ncbi:hypothetical protein H4Q26_015175 [Puccinia striiformis f. sp. tritici PST-130]|nr:hypothetical protein H4Q26_015175 [Puccinia striiformis f. sp. tritici PST-130]